MPGTIAEGPSVSCSFANNFWGKDDAGVPPMLDRMHNAKVTCDELKAFYTARASIEEEYAKKLLALCRKPLGSCETGTLRESFDSVRTETEAIAKAHSAIASQIKIELEEPLAAFAGGIKERRKIVQNGIERLLKTKIQQTQAVNKARDRYEQDCLRIKGYLAQGHMVMGQEERRNKAKLEKTQAQLASNSTDYEAAIKILEDTTGRWNKEWKSACDKFQDLEEERLDFTKSSLWTYANIASTVCVSDDASCEKIRLSLENCEVERDIVIFIKEAGTGQEIPDAPKFINFCRGDLNDSSSEISEEDGYSVAQFQRTINPAFRSSSPQPSTYESHHDPDCDLAAKMNYGGVSAPSIREATVTPQKPPMPPQQPVEEQPPQQSFQQPRQQQYQKPLKMLPQQQPLQQQPPQQPKQPPQMQQAPQMQQEPRMQQPPQMQQEPRMQQPPQTQQAPQLQQVQQPLPLDLRRGGQPPPNYDPNQHGEIGRVPHNAYPTDGMTMFCRTGPPSERSSGTSAYRPSSRDSQSECSNPTSVSSQEAVTAKPSPAKSSPTKPTNGVALPGMNEERQVQKRRSAFFSNSPFRRKSRHDKDRQATGSSSRSGFDSKQSSPVKPAAVQPPVLDQGGSASPEPVDPRANFQLNVGNNVFDVASPEADRAKKAAPKTKGGEGDLDPIARALADLKGPGKQPSTRVSADRYHGIATPVPSAPSSTYGSTSVATPPPAYDSSSLKRLDAPQPAFTSAQMQKTTRKYVDQTQNMFRTSNPSSSSSSSSRPATRGGEPPQEVPRARSPAPVTRSPVPRARSPAPAPRSPVPHTRSPAPASRSPAPATRSPAPRARSPAPPRSVSPQVAPRVDTRMSQYSRGASPSPSTYQTNSLNSRYAQSPTMAPASPRTSDVGYSPQEYPKRGSQSSYTRNASPQPQFRQQARPSSAGGMELQLSGNHMDMYDSGGRQDRYGSRSSRDGRPASSYYGSHSDAGSQGRARSRTLTVADPNRQYSRDGRAVLHFARAMYSYTAAIPEELGFSKGDVLAVIRLQDDGWWEAEVTSTRGHPGLVPSNYLQII
ncbi:hypothetical protein ASPZODRAFT_87894 [Penicilliopsis zonata CBS 506.65]|uniref:SH3 domain-containing protein n=1 Tax=Penicilliopsis zonata CBS 506.65 TaxID=1073090 RepID=A0A1L9SWD2_9EURO|nr:hypothetical protein ASPZODRAFT_87894 [Penicilliopsis zonata CBS 506.65]OJJ51486.1 hypothetical protein ASPZODRAFT_87894 [Penicilliopsis zonata CBS 506.65]